MPGRWRRQHKARCRWVRHSRQIRQWRTPRSLLVRGEGCAAVVLKVVEVRSKATTLALPLPTNRVLLSGLKASPSGADSGFTPLARAAQHCAPGKPPNKSLAPKPGMWKLSVRQPKRVQLPKPVTIGGMNCVGAVGLSVAQELALIPPPATPFAPEKKFTAMSC